MSPYSLNREHFQPTHDRLIDHFAVSYDSRYLRHTDLYAHYTLAAMLVLAETAIGFVVFKLSSDAKLDNKDLWKEFETPEGANKA